MKNIISGADTNWYKDILKKPETVRKYHRFFRERDTLLNIPKTLEDYVEKNDPEAYEKAKSDAKEARSKIKFDEIYKTYPEKSAIKQDEESSEDSKE